MRSAVSGYVTGKQSAKVKGRARVGFRFNTVSARGEARVVERINLLALAAAWC